MEYFDENAFATHSHVELDANASTKSSENIKVYQHGIEAVWSTTAQLHEATKLVI
jgi:hypothetical protein